MKPHNYYGDVYVTVRMRLRIDLNQDKKPTKDSVLKILKTQSYNDILDEETLAYVSVEKVDLKKQ